MASTLEFDLGAARILGTNGAFSGIEGVLNQYGAGHRFRLMLADADESSSPIQRSAKVTYGHVSDDQAEQFSGGRPLAPGEPRWE